MEIGRGKSNSSLHLASTFSTWIVSFIFNSVTQQGTSEGLVQPFIPAERGSELMSFQTWMQNVVPIFFTESGFTHRNVSHFSKQLARNFFDIFF